MNEINSALLDLIFFRAYYKDKQLDAINRVMENHVLPSIILLAEAINQSSTGVKNESSQQRRD